MAQKWKVLLSVLMFNKYLQINGKHMGLVLREPKIPLRLEFTDKELDIIDQLTITLALVFEKIMENISAKGLLKQSSKMSSSLRYQTIIAYVIDMALLYRDQGRFPNEIKNDIVKLLSEQHQQDLLKNESLLSKVFKNFDNDGITFRIKGDNKIKEQLSTGISRKPKAKRPRPVGRHVISKLTRTVEEYKRILSNPNALNLINSRLLKYGSLKETYSIITREAFNIFEKGDESFFSILKMFQTLFPNVDDTSLPDPKLFQERFKSLSEGEKENFRQEIISYIVENPSGPVLFIFSLYKLGSHNSQELK